MKRAGKVMEELAREMVTTPSSRGWRSTSRVERLNSGQFVQEEHAVVGQAHLPRPGVGAAADEPGVGDGVVRGPEGPLAQEPLARLRAAP